MSQKGRDLEERERECERESEFLGDGSERGESGEWESRGEVGDAGGGSVGRDGAAAQSH